jgi:hypothetical protein
MVGVLLCANFLDSKMMYYYEEKTHHGVRTKGFNPLQMISGEGVNEFESVVPIRMTKVRVLGLFTACPADA